jgi:hypothetical protein
MVIFHSYVSLPEGTQKNMILEHILNQKLASRRYIAQYGTSLDIIHVMHSVIYKHRIAL